MKQLGEAINESISDSDQIAEVISKIKTGGYDVFLVLEATIGFNKREEEEQATHLDVRTNESPDLKISPQDVKFLRSLRITVDSSDNGSSRDNAA